MDGLSAASGVIAVASLGIQLADSVNRLHAFIGAIKESPKEIHSICTGLSVISSILDRICYEDPRTAQDTVLFQALLECDQHVQALTFIAKSLMPGFASASPLARSWTALKAVKKAEKIRKFQDRLEQAKTTLILAQQDSVRRLQLEQNDAQQNALSNITQTLQEMQAQTSYQSEVISAYYANREDYLEDVFREIRRVSSSWANPIIRSQLETKLREAVQSTLDSLPEKQDIASSKTELEPDKEAELQIEASLYSLRWKRRCVARASSSLSTIFGQIHCSSQAYRILYPGYGSSSDLMTGQQRKNFVVDSSFWLVPSSWLTKFGISYAVNIQVARSSQAGWNHVLKSFNLAPDSALVFDFCRSGNVDGVRTLFSKGLASVRDINSEGSTPLHIAAANCHPQLCRMLIQQGADTSATKWVAWEHAIYTRDQDYSSLAVQKEHRQIETFRVFLSAGEEINDEDFSMDIQLSNFCDRALLDQGVVKRPDFIYPSIWLLNQLLAAAKQSPYLYDYDWWLWRLIDAMLSTPNQQPVAEVLKHCSDPVIHSAMIHWVWLLDHPDRGHPFRMDDLTDFKRMFEKVGTLHFRAKRFNPADEDDDTSPLEMAMRKSQSFNRLRTVLGELDVPLESYIREEAALLEDAGWTYATLIGLFNDDYHPPRYENLDCNFCDLTELWGTYWHEESLWKQRLDRIKAGKDPEGPFSEDEVRVQEEWATYIHNFVELRICSICQARGRERRVKDEGVLGVVKLGLSTPMENLESE